MCCCFSQRIPQTHPENQVYDPEDCRRRGDDSPSARDGFQKLALTLHVLHVIQQLILGVTVYLDIPGASASAIVADKLVILDLVAVHHTHFLTTKSTNLLTKFLLKTNRQKT